VSNTVKQVSQVNRWVR